MTTLQTFLDSTYLPSRVNIGARTAYEYQIVLRHFTRFAGDVFLSDLTDDLICRFLRHRLETSSPATVNGNRAKLLALWRAAWRKRLVDELPRDIPKLREPQHVPRAWTVDEVSQLVAYSARMHGKVGVVLKRDWWTSLIRTTWETGQRIGALMQARQVDCDLDGQTLLVRAASTKTGLGQVYLLSIETINTIAPVLRPTEPLIWAWPHCRRWFYIHFRRIVEAAGLSAGSHHDLFHKLRRSNLSYTALGGGIELARQQAGHDHASTTLRHYIDPRIAQQRSARDVLPPLS